MSFYYPTRQPAIAPNILVRKERYLPLAGDVLVRTGSRVEPDDVVASAVIPAQPVFVDVARQLGVAPERGLRLMTKAMGQDVVEGEVIAARRGFGAGQVRSPAAGTLTEYDERSGLLAIVPPSDVLNLQAHIKGIVTEQIPFRGVAIETPAAVVRGVFGLGGEKHGVLKVASSDPGEELMPDSIDARLTYSIVLGGGTTSAAALAKAVEHRVRAIIIGSIPEPELRLFMGYPPGSSGWSMGRTGWEFPPRPRGVANSAMPDLTLIVVEGFGRLPMASKAWELLAAYDGQEAAVEGTTRLRGGIARPEVIVPLSRAEATLPLDTIVPRVGVGSQVRLLSGEQMGRMGEVVAMSSGKRALPSGVLANAAEVRLIDGSRIWMPTYNMEVVSVRA